MYIHIYIELFVQVKLYEKKKKKVYFMIYTRFNYLSIVSNLLSILNFILIIHYEKHYD